MNSSQEAYDRASTIFSPDGRLFQVEYAREAIKRGTTTVGIKFKDGIVLIVDKRISSHLVEPDSIEKIFQIDKHIACATSGLVSDGRTLVDRARVDAQINEITYNEQIPVKTLVKQICNFKQVNTQYGGVRPFGTSLLIAGVDDQGIWLFSTDPSGAYVEYKAGSEGHGRREAMEYFEKNYKNNMSMDDAIAMGIKAIDKGTENKLKPESIEIATITIEKKFQKIPIDQTKMYVEKTLK